MEIQASMTNQNSNTTEIWKTIPNYENLYEISNFGRVRSRQKFLNRKVRTHLLKPQESFGYLRVTLSKSRKTQRIFLNRLVLMVFVRLPKKGEQASHIDGNRANNHLTNLLWETPKANNARKKEHGTHQIGENCPSAKLTAQKVREIRARAAIGEMYVSIAPHYGISPNTVGDVVKRRRWKHI